MHVANSPKAYTCGRRSREADLGNDAKQKAEHKEIVRL
jgi:hypothetical protein